MLSTFIFWYRERDLNPHSHHWPKDFKSFVSTDSTIAAQNRVQRYNKKCTYANKTNKKFTFSVILLQYYCYHTETPAVQPSNQTLGQHLLAANLRE